MFNGSKFLQKLWNGRQGARGQGGPEDTLGKEPVATVDEPFALLEGERTIAMGQIWQQVSAAINERDPEDWNAWHWLQDLYYDQGQLFAITISGGRLFRWPVMVDGDTVMVGDPVAVQVQFTETSEPETVRKLRQALRLGSTSSPTGSGQAGGSLVRQTKDGRWIGCSILCTATVNKMGILDSRKLFDSFVERFEGSGTEYINVLHLGGGQSRIGTLRHIWREDKLLVGLYEFTKGDAVAEACARTLAADEDGYWGGSIEFRHFGQPLLVEVAEGIKLPTTHDGKLFGYSVARNMDCAAWYTGNVIVQERTMTDKDRAVALELLGDAELVDQLAGRLDDANRTLADAVTYSVGQADKVTGWQGDKVTNVDGTLTLSPPHPVTLSGEQTGEAEGEPMVYELEPDALEQIADQVAQHRSVTGLVAEVGAAAHRRHEQLALQFEQRVGEALQRIETLAGDLEQRATALNERLGRLEQDDQSRYREYDAAKPKQPVVKFGVRPRERQVNGVPDVKQESKFASRARERRAKA